MANALLQLESMQSKLDALERAKTEPIAIIGIGCRFPGGIDNPEAFWRILHDGVDTITEVPKNRWDIDSYYDPDPDTTGKIYTRDGGFLTEVDTFDSQFFKILPREATSLDPQQRLLLEVSWEALEYAHQVSEQLYNSLTGVFVGISTNDYAKRLLGTEAPDAYFGTGNAFSAAAGRLSYVLGLTGPSMAVDTACSSSLVAVHLACQSLRQQECHLALAGGVNLLLSPEASITFSQGRMLAPDGRCKTFDAAANGYVRGEGCGIIVLKRLSDAIASQDQILAVIRGSAINQDGPSGGLTVPNGPSQQAVIRQALKNGGVDPVQVSYIEAHGTGTSLGDPIEVGAIGAVFGASHSQEHPLIIGSLKTNIGHLEAAAGIAGLLKVVLQLQHQEIAPHLHLREPNPYINWDELPLNVPTQPTPWSAGSEKLFAGVSSFGFSGTNAHVVLEEAPSQFKSRSRSVGFAESPLAPLNNGGNSKVKSEDFSERPFHLLTLSAKSREALTELATRYQKHLETHQELALGDICFSANTGRTHFKHRLAVVASSSVELKEKLAAFSISKEVAGLYQKELQSTTTKPKVAFLFTGQGSQYVNMGRELYEQEPIFRKTLEQCDTILRLYQQKPLLSVLYPEPGETSPIDETAYTQPALFAIEYALAQLWKSWGIEPDVVMGHSVGEYVAACVAGVFSLEDGLKLIAERARLMNSLPQDGAMVSVIASVEQVRANIGASPSPNHVAIAAINAPESTVISGLEAGVQAVADQLQIEGVKTKPLKVSHGFHSPLMEPMIEEFKTVARQVSYSEPKIKMISNVTGEVATVEVATAEYWCRHIFFPVNFVAGMETLHQSGYEVFLECGPKPILLGLGRQCISKKTCIWLPSLRPRQEDWQQILQSLGELYVRGLQIDWKGFEGNYPRSKVTLPTYPFQRKRFWIEVAENYAKHEPVKEIEDSYSSFKERYAITGHLTVDNIQRCLTDLMAKELGIDTDTIDSKIDFDRYGIDSVLAVGIAQTIGSVMGVKISPLDLMQNSNLEQLSKFIANQASSQEREVLEI
ncbi:beta-ketoacyl synthase [Moorena producens PAL-8-15-08-1]|uniref:Beta-ketoacyl synthase n=2 Tax=Moorena TaxID=1155738 RepID=A0A1D8TVU8_9CYAN|nr:beta-ketoacyl synthase [Moorena producens PAL-8-15-08-1]